VKEEEKSETTDLKDPATETVTDVDPSQEDMKPVVTPDVTNPNLNEDTSKEGET